MNNLETRLSETKEGLEVIKEKVATSIMQNMEEDLGLTYRDIFEGILNESQMKEYDSSEMTRDMCRDLVRIV